MSDCSFQIPFTGNAGDFVNKIRQAVQKVGGKMTGNDNEGSIAVDSPVGDVAGIYKIDGQRIAITITKKPFFISCDKIKSMIGNYVK